MKSVSACLLFLLLHSCIYNSKNESEKDKFEIISTSIDDSCSLYLMYYFSGDYMYRIGTTDVCNDFTWEKYVSSYRSLLVKNIDSLILEDGKVIFETDYNFGMDSTFRKKLIELTEKQFGRTSIIVEEETNHDELTIQLK